MDFNKRRLVVERFLSKFPESNIVYLRLDVQGQVIVIQALYKMMRACLPDLDLIEKDDVSEIVMDAKKGVSIDASRDNQYLPKK